jgi:hypothetical protein
MMEPQITERDVALLLLSEQSLLALGAVLGWKARAALVDDAHDSPQTISGVLPA